MKNKNYRESKLKYQLKELRTKGKKSVVWKLSSDQVEYLKQFYRIEPELYKIRTRYFSKALCSSYPILKHLNNEKLYNNHSYMISKLKKGDLAILDEFDVHYSVLKYRVKLA